MRKYKKKFLLIVVTLCLFGSRLFEMEVKAAEGNVLFGSQSYAWNATDICPIGVYFNGSVPISSYSICLEYDENVLQYLDGADRVEGNRLYIEGNGLESSYKRMLHFMPKEEVETRISMVSAVGMGISVSETGEIVEEAITVVQPSAVPIVVKKKPSSKLLDLKVPEAKGMEAFQADVMEYQFEVEDEISELELHYETEEENALVEVSETKLVEGRNRITITVRGEKAEPMVYTLLVERKEKIVEVEASQEASEYVVPSTEPAKEVVAQLEEMESIEDARDHLSAENELSKTLQVALILVGVFALIYLGFYSRNRKKLLLTEYERSDELYPWKDVNLDMIIFEQTVIEVKNVTMNFRLAQDESSSLKEYLIKSFKGKNHYRTLAALKNICFEVKQGDVLGIIGTNGSGKSTLLKIIAGALHPSEGEVVVDKNKVQMLTLGTGFDMELTARENVYLNGALIGYTREYIDEKYHAIVAFAELDGFMEERMKNFSSGMVSRLGFAIATMRDAPDILILDEVLSVGDLFFKKKSEKRIRQLIHSGATILIVSHSADVIRKNCDKAVWIEKGVMRMIGEPEVVCGAYEQMEIKD